MPSHEFKRLKRAGRVLFNRLLGREFISQEPFTPATIEVSGVCNLQCVFCAYREKDTGKVVMSNAAFADYLDQYAAMGYDHLMMTPQTGDVFIDKHFQDKIDLIEAHPAFNGFEFITNLISASPPVLEALGRSKKLARMYVSLYGHNLENFKRITKRPESQYRRLVDNLNRLADMGADFKAPLGAFVMTDRDVDFSPESPPGSLEAQSEVFAAVRRLCENHPDFIWTGNHVDFDSWGGRITQADVEALGLGFRVVGPSVPMQGPCAMLFGGQVLLADGRVNACACRAVGGGLIIGDANQQPLAEILSPDNPQYRAILERHQRGDYPDDCKGCKIFTSIYRKPHGRPTVSVEEFLNAQRDRCARSNSDAREAS